MSARINPGKANLIKSSLTKSSLVGGIAVGIAGMVLWVAVTHELGFDGPVTWGIGLLVCAAVATWIRLADL
jgi:hypothetical protein